MKKFLVIGLLAISAMALSQQQASAWINSRFGVGMNWDFQAGGNSLLWGLVRSAQSENPDRLVLVDVDGPLDLESVRAFCDGRIAHYKVPRYVKITDGFPMTVSGKIQKFRMREQSTRELGLERSHLYKKCQQLGIDIKEERAQA